jgi:iron complex outermembrane recepter protein
MKTFFIRITMILGAFLIVSSFPVVYAQENASDEFTLEEITVTAEKRTTDVQKTALSVTAISGDNIRDEAKSTLESVLRDVASVEVGYSNRGGQINIRGIGSYVDTSMADPAVAVIEDNIYNGNSLATMGFMYDTDRIEVLRGPQGTLYGRNATGGTINVLSRKPVDKFEVTANFQIGDYNLKHFDGAVNIPLSEKWAARVAFLRDTRDGYLSSGDMDSNVFGFRAKVNYEPTDKFTVLATYEYFWEDDHGSNTVPIPGSAGNLPRLGPPPNFGWTVPDVNHDGIADDFLSPDPDNPGLFLNAPNGTPDLIDTGWIVPNGSDEWEVDEWHPAGSSFITKSAYSLQLDWDLGWAQLTAVPSIADSHNLNIDSHLAGIAQTVNPYSVNALGTGQDNYRKQTSGEIRLASAADSKFTWLVGYYYMKSDNSRPGFQQQDPTTYSDANWHFVTNSNPNVTNALFGQATYPVSDRLRLTGGLRYSKDDLEMEFRYGTNPLYNDVAVYDSGWLFYSQSIKSTTYKAGIEFDVAEKSMLYAQISTGFKQGGLNLTAPPTKFKPEELVAYEFGSKNRFLDNRMQLNFEAFLYNYDNMQAQMPTFAPVGNSGTQAMIMGILNAEKGTLKGADLELQYLFTQNDRIVTSASYLSSEIGHFIIPGPNPFGLTAPFDMTGRPMSSTPKWAGTLAYEHTWLFENGATVTSRLDTKISTGYYRTLEQWIPYAWNEGYHRSNLNVTYKSPDGKWSTGVWANNLENGAQYTWSVPFYRAQIKPPRTFGVNISVRY